MSTPWPKVRLGEVLRQVCDEVPVSPEAVYPMVGVLGFGRGVYFREHLPGTKTSYTSFYRVAAGDLLLSRVKAWEGALGVVPHAFHGHFVSKEFPSFRPNSTNVIVPFIDLFLKSRAGIDQLSASTRGLGARRERVKEAAFLSIQVPLPPIDEQRRIVARIEAVAEQIQDARSHQQSVHDALDGMLSSAYHSIAEHAPRRPLADVAPLYRRPVAVDAEQSYPQVSVRSFGRGTFHKPPLAGADVTWEKPFLVKAGDILVSNIKAWEGAIAVAGPADDGRFGSHRYLTFAPRPGIANARFVCFHLLTPDGLHAVGEASPGSADRNRTLGSKAMLQVPIPLPAFDKQAWFEAVYAQVETAKRLQAESAAELDALLPAVLDLAFRGELP